MDTEKDDDEDVELLRIVQLIENRKGVTKVVEGNRSKGRPR